MIPAPRRRRQRALLLAPRDLPRPGPEIIELLLDAGADVDRPWDRWDRGRRPLALAVRCGHLDAYELLAALGASAELNDVDAAVLVVARGEPTRLPIAPPPSLV